MRENLMQIQKKQYFRLTNQVTRNIAFASPDHLTLKKKVANQL